MTRVAGGTPAVAGLFWNSWHDPGDRIRNRPLCIPALYLLSLSCRGYLPREPLPFSFEKDGSLALRPSSVKVNIFLWLFVQRIVSIYMHLFLLYRLSSQEWESFTWRFIQRYESAWSGTPFPPFSWTKAADSRLWSTENIVFFFIFPLEPRPLAHPRPRVIVTAHWNGLWSAGLGSAGSTTTKTAK